MMKKFWAAILALSMPFAMNAQGLFKKLDDMNKAAEAKKDKAGRWDGDQYIIDGNGTVVFNDGTVQEGTVKYVVTTDLSLMRYFYFTPAYEMKERKYSGKEVQYFTIDNRNFYPIRTKEDDLTIGNSKIFMERLNNSDNDKFKMYFFRKVEAKPQGFATASEPYEVKNGYWVHLPEFKNAHEIVDITFTPFAKKMSDYLKDCPELSEKIKKKQEGYKYNMFNLNGNDEVFLRIMNEYNSCSQ